MKFFAMAILLLSFQLSGADDLAKTISKSFSVIDENISVTDVRESPVKGVFEVEVNGREYVYSTEDGGYVFWGKLIKIHSDGFTDMTEQRVEGYRESVLGNIDVSSSITFSSEAESNEVYIFTDISCGYCRKLHENIEQINDLGITVHYLAFPRSGINSELRKAMDNIWCDEHPESALTKAKISGDIPDETPLCRSPVASHFLIGNRLNVTGTPAIYTLDGRHIGGYLTAREMLDAINK